MNPAVSFHDPSWLAAFVAVGAVIWLRRWRAAKVFLVPFAATWASTTARRLWWPWLVLLGGLGLLILALARPQRQHAELLPAEGCDVMLAVDVSLSMGSQDFSHNGRPISRLQAAKTMIDAFVARRSNDRIGLVVFGGRAYTVVPPTLDHDWLRRQLGRVQIGLGGEGTAIGDALVVALKRLAEAMPPAAVAAPAKFIVLLTDGANNSGIFAPSEAILAAERQNVTIHAIATGSHGWVRAPVEDAAGHVEMKMIRSEYDEQTLGGIAYGTGGQFFRAEWPDALEQAFREIDRAQKVAFEPRVVVRRQELFGWFAGPGVALLAIGAVAIRWPGRRWVAA